MSMWLPCSFLAGAAHLSISSGLCLTSRDGNGDPGHIHSPLVTAQRAGPDLTVKV